MIKVNWRICWVGLKVHANGVAVIIDTGMKNN